MAESKWWISDAPVPYDTAIRRMEAQVAAIAAGEAGDTVWLLEHPPLYTAGTSAKPADLIDPDRLPVHQTGRGGQYTYHGPGQRIAYVMRDLRPEGNDLRAYVRSLEQWIIDTLDRFNIKGERRSDRVGVWIDRGGGREDKIAAIGVRVRHWVTYHGISFNVDPALEHYQGIVACGVAEHGVTSLVDLGLTVAIAEVDAELRHTFPRLFR